VGIVCNFFVVIVDVVVGKINQKSARSMTSSCFFFMGGGWQGNGRVFCAGGDLRMFYNAQKAAADDPSTTEVVYSKYWLDYHAATYKKPLIALWTGLVMGGGAGLTVPGRYGVATEKTVFSMPEAALGLHTDCGSSFWLSRLPGHLGEYLALTGSRLDGAEMLACGLATHFVPLEVFTHLRCLLE
jgi:3-hydroxyisobutyryl-CoA hydrolase